jgi:hypothetical protein
LTRRRLTALAAAASAVAILVPAAPAGAGPTAQKSGEELVQILTTGKLKVRSDVKVTALCAANCQISGQLTLKAKGPNASFFLPPITLVAGQTAEAVLSLNKGARRIIKEQIKTTKLKAEFTAQNSLTGEIDVDEKTFKFKR